MTDDVRSHKGVQAYRWIVSLGIAALGALSLRVLMTVDDMAKDVRSLQVKVEVLTTTVTNLAGQLAAAERRNDTQDVKLYEIERRVWQLAPRP